MCKVQTRALETPEAGVPRKGPERFRLLSDAIISSPRDNCSLSLLNTGAFLAVQ